MKLKTLLMTLAITPAAIAAFGAEPYILYQGAPTACAMPLNGLDCQPGFKVVPDWSGCRILCVPEASASDVKCRILPYPNPEKMLHKERFSQDLEEQTAGIAKLSDSKDFAGLGRKLDALFDDSASNAAASPAPTVVVPLSSSDTSMKDAVSDLPGARDLRAAAAAEYYPRPFPRPCPQQPKPWEDAGLRPPTPDCDPVPAPLTQAPAPMLVAGASEEVLKKVAPIIIDQAGRAAERAGDKINDEGARRAREGAEKQREQEKKWEGKERNYPQYGK